MKECTKHIVNTLKRGVLNPEYEEWVFPDPEKLLFDSIILQGLFSHRARIVENRNFLILMEIFLPEDQLFLQLWVEHDDGKTYITPFCDDNPYDLGTYDADQTILERIPDILADLLDVHVEYVKKG